MNDMTRIPGPGGGPDRDPERERHERRLRALERLADVGMNLARDLLARVEGKNGAPPEPLTMEMVDRFVRISRSVRLCVALSSKLEAAGPAPQRRVAPPTALPARGPATGPASLPGGPPDRWQRERAWVRYVVERSIAAVPDLRRREGLFLDMEDLLDEAESEMEWGHRPLDEIVEEICEELGITPDPKLLANPGTDRDSRGRGPTGPQILPAPRRQH
jgi:hypothetical protein